MAQNFREELKRTILAGEDHPTPEMLVDRALDAFENLSLMAEHLATIIEAKATQ